MEGHWHRVGLKMFAYHLYSAFVREGKVESNDTAATSQEISFLICTMGLAVPIWGD